MFFMHLVENLRPVRMMTKTCFLANLLNALLVFYFPFHGAMLPETAPQRYLLRFFA